MNTEKSKGHIAYIAGYEYFSYDGNLYRACVVSTYIMDNGYRSGGRWQCPMHMAESYIEQIRSVCND